MKQYLSLFLLLGLGFVQNSAAQSTAQISINEIMYDPPSGSEYVELYNHSSNSIDIQGWTLSDNRDTRELIIGSTFTVPADSFVVIAPDSSLFSNPEYTDIGLIEVSGFPGLNNGGDAIVIHNNSRTTVDSVNYESNWGGSDIALERRSAITGSNIAQNWGNSPDGYGTPGRRNQIADDRKPPSLASLIIENNRLVLRFSEQLDEHSAAVTGNYALPNGPAIAAANFASPDSVYLQLTSNLQNNSGYTLTIKNVTDVFGNAADIDTTFTYYDVSAVDSGDVAINEIMAAPPASSSEYVELYNHSDKSLNLQDWSISDSGQNRDPITNNQFIVPPDSFVVIAADKSLESSFPDITIVQMSSFPSLNNGGDAITIRDENGTLLDSLTYTSNWGEDEIALERRSIDVIASYKANWASAINGFGTPGRANTVSPDTVSPTLENLVIERNKLTLIFSERLKHSIAEDLSNYTFPSGPAIAEAHFAAPDSVKLQFDNNLQNNITYDIGIVNIADIFGNPIAPTDTTFTFYEVSPADSGDIFVNEFNYEPISGSTEYIELYNPTNRSFNLQNWTVADNRGTGNVITRSQYIVPPDSFVVIAPDNTLLSDNPDISLVSMGGFPALNNSGDDIILRNESGTRLDSLRYTSEWGGDNVALERRTTAVSGTYRENWSEAPNGSGTPGADNNVAADQTPPLFDSVTALDATTLELNFSEKITASSATEQQNYQISPDVGIQLVSAKENEVTLYLTSELRSGDTYEITVYNIKDVFGNTLSRDTKPLDYLRIDKAGPGDVVINEVLYNPGDGGDADFVELYNTTDNNFELSNWRIGDSSSEATLPDQLQLPAKSYVVLTGVDRFARTVPNGRDVSSFPSYNNNSGDAVYIQTNNGRTIDSLQYETSWGGSAEGTSMERVDPLAASNDASNWVTSDEVSAGNRNISFQPDNHPPKVIFAQIHPNGNIEVRFSEFIALSEEVTFLANGNLLEVTSFDSTRANVIYLSGNLSKDKGDGTSSATITVRNLSDVKGNTAASSKVAIAQPLQRGDLAINEIMFNPLDDPDDNKADQSEYLELRNTQEYAISLEGIFLHDAPDEDGNTRNLQPVSTTAKWVPARGNVLLHADAASTFDESMTANFFEISSPAMRSIMRVDRSSLSLASSDDAIYIADSTGVTIDSVYYGESWHNPNIIDTRGIALERVSPQGPSDKESNWGSSVNPKGGTPNRENSIYQANADQSQNTGISFTPNPFSPDGDGYEDNLFINYKLDQQDYLIKVSIYDRYGRLVRELADGQQAGFEGQLIWNGRKDDGSRNRIGIYIVVFEAYDSATGADNSFKKTVVLARRLN
jgi:P pilus assembly chaperone PapD